jgi:hypothetical protein
MTQVIIYNQDNGTPAVVMPTQEAIDAHGIMAIAIKDVPVGKPFASPRSGDIKTASAYQVSVTRNDVGNPDDPTHLNLSILGDLA